MHIGNLDGTSASAPRNRWAASVEITVHEGVVPIAGATVEGTWSNGANGSGLCTVQVGETFCTITKSNIKGNVNSVAFTVTAVTSATHAYDAAINHDPGRDSDGTTITITKP